MLFRLSEATKSYGGTEILRGVSFQVNPGEKVGLVGRNGAGKTTVFRLITGQEAPDSGGVFKANNIEAIVYPTSSRRPQRIDAPPDPPGGAATNGSNLANLSGFPDLIVPAGFSTEDLPIGISFLGPAFTESRLLAIGYAFEQATKARRLPVHTPLRTGDSIAVP